MYSISTSNFAPLRLELRCRPRRDTLHRCRRRLAAPLGMFEASPCGRLPLAIIPKGGAQTCRHDSSNVDRTSQTVRKATDSDRPPLGRTDSTIHFCIEILLQQEARMPLRLS